MEKTNWPDPNDKANRPNAKDLIVMKSMIFNLKTLQVWGPHTPALVAFSKLNFDFDENATCEPWIEFLQQICCKNLENIETLQQWFGYMISNSKKHDKMLLIVGPPRGGKGTIVHVLTELLGRNNCAFPRISQLSGRFTFSEFIDKTAIIFNDVRTNKFTINARATELLLSLTSRDRISIDIKHKAIDSYDLKARVIMATNITPEFNDPSGAMNTRLVPIKLTEHFTESQQDKTLLKKLLKVTPGIFNWALKGLKQLELQDEFTISEDSADEIIGDVDSSQQVKQYIMERYNYGDNLEDKSAYVFTYNMFIDYVTWCEVRRYSPGDIATFGRELGSVAWMFDVETKKRTNKNKSDKIGRQIQERAWLGLQLKKEHHPEL